MVCFVAVLNGKDKKLKAAEKAMNELGFAGQTIAMVMPWADLAGWLSQIWVRAEVECTKRGEEEEEECWIGARDRWVSAC